MPGLLTSEKLYKKLRARYLLWLALFLIFTWWAAIAIMKYRDQPLATDIIPRFGDDKNGIQFPLITFCQDHTNLDICGIKDETIFVPFNDNIFNCLKNDKNFAIDTFLENLPYERENVIDKTHLWNGSDYIDLNYLEHQLWSRVFHSKWGLCYTFDISNTKEFEYVPYGKAGRPGIEFSLTDNNPWYRFLIILHSKNDFPDGLWLNGR